MDFTRYIWELYAASDCGRTAISWPAKSLPDVVIGWNPFALWLPLVRSGPDGQRSCIDGEFVRFHVREDVRAHFSVETVTDACAAKTLFTSLVDEGLSISIRGAGEERCFFAGTGNHIVVLTALFERNDASTGYYFYFDYLWPLVPQDVPDPQKEYADVSLAIDFDTDHGYKKPPAWHLWHLQKLGFKGHADVYMGVFWNNKRRRVGAT